LVTDECLDRVLVIDLDRTSPTYNTVVNRTYVGINPEKVGFVGALADGNLTAWVANELGTVDVIDAQPGSPTQYRIVATLPLDESPEAIAAKATSAGLRVYVTQELSNTVAVFDAQNYSLV